MERKADGRSSEGKMLLDHFPGSDDKPESGIYDWKSVDGGNSAPHRSRIKNGSKVSAL